MKALRYLRSRVAVARAARDKRAALSAPREAPLSPADFAASLGDPTAFYLRAFRDYQYELPGELREHRGYFEAAKRGFGEAAFHTMWKLLFDRFQPSEFLEIGVYRGQVLSLVSLLAKHAGRECHVTGISPFSPAGDSVSEYLAGLDYREDTLANFRHFGLPEPRLVQAYSTDPEAVEAIRRGAWDMIYIDGNHDYEVVMKDWETCSRAVKPGGVIVLDDAGLTTSYSPPAFATGGHPGPSQLASEIDREEFEEILQVGHNRVFQRRP